MSEIEKLYKNAKVKPVCDGLDCFTCTAECNNCKYPEFTAEKQLDIVKQILFSTWWMNLKRLQFAEKFDEGLAQMINEFWQDLTEEEKQQINEILEGR